MPASEGKILELVVFRLDEEATNEQLLATADAVSRWIGEQPGFVSRDLVHDPEGDRWIDVVWWDSLEEAQAASELALTSAACAPMFALIDMESILMLHGELAARRAPLDQ